MAPQLAWMGLGNMGRGMCKNLVEKGNLSQPLIIYNRTTSRAQDLSDKLGAGRTKVASSLEEAVSSSDIVFICLGDDNSVTSNVDTIIKGGIKGKILVDCSTVHPDTTDSISQSITDAGGHFVACPVFGAPAMAESGSLVCVLAGPKDAVDKVKPYTKGVMGRADIDYSGQKPGNATRLKVIGNTFVFNMVEALAEGHTLAEKSGLGQENLHQFIETMFPGPYVAYSGRMMSGDYYQRDEPLFQVDLALKDARHALDLANSSGTKLKATELVNQHLKDVKEAAGEKGDMPGIYGAVRKESGLKYGNKG